MAFFHLEPFVDQATETLRQGLDARIDVINGETSDFDVVKPAPEAYYPGGVDIVVANPSVEVAAPDWDISNPDIAQLAWDADYVLMVRVWYEHPDFQRLYRSLMRYGRAVSEVLAQRDALGAGVTITRMRGAYRVNPETNERLEFDGGALVVVTFETVEVRP